MNIIDCTVGSTSTYPNVSIKLTIKLEPYRIVIKLKIDQINLTVRDGLMCCPLYKINHKVNEVPKCSEAKVSVKE